MSLIQESDDAAAIANCNLYKDDYTTFFDLLCFSYGEAVWGYIIYATVISVNLSCNFILIKKSRQRIKQITTL